MNSLQERKDTNHLVQIPTSSATLEGNLVIPEAGLGLVLFAHGSGSSRYNPRNRYVAQVLRDGGLGTLLIDLLTPEEEMMDMHTRHLRFDIDLLTQRLIEVTDWLVQHPAAQGLNIGYFGTKTGGGAALAAAAKRPDVIRAVVLRGGRPDLAGPALRDVRTPTLLIVGGDDLPVMDLNMKALAQLRTTKKVEIIPGATHLFEEPGALAEAALLARHWFKHYLSR